MKRRNNLISAVLVAGTVLPTTATKADNIEHNNYPVNYNNCKFIVTEPENSGGYLYSRDCKKIYVLPPANGEITATTNLADDSVLQSMCSLLDDHMKRHEIKSKMYLKITERMEKLDINKPSERAEYERLSEQAATLDKEMKEAADPFRKYEAGKALVRIDARIKKELIDQFYQLNQNLVYQEQVKFEAMPLGKGYLTVSDYKADDTILFKSLLGFYVGGIKVKSEGQQENIYQIHSGTSAQLIMGAKLACDMRKRILNARVENREITSQMTGALLAGELLPAYSYSYPVMSTVGYKAKLDIKRAMDIFSSHEKTKSQFTVGEFAESLGNGQITDAFIFEADLGVLSEKYSSEESRADFMKELRTEIRTRLATRLLAELERLKLLDFELDSDLVVPQPGFHEEVIGTQRICERRKFAGITYKKRCHDQVIKRRTPVDGQLEEARRLVESLELSFTETSEINELVPAVGNVLFK